MRLRHAGTALALSLLIGCGDGTSSPTGPAGPVGSSSLDGRVVIAAREPGPLLVVAHRPDGAFLGHALAEGDRFTIALDEPVSGRVLLQAVDPADPNHYAAAVADLAAPSASPQASPQQSDASDDLTIDARTTAAAVVRAVKGSLEEGELGSVEADQAVDLAEAIADTGFDVCQEPSPEVTAALQEIAQETTPILEIYDEIAAGEGTLLERLRRGQQEITRTITSLNQPASINFWTHGMNHPARLIAGRAMLAAYGSLTMWGYQTVDVSRDELQSIAHTIAATTGGNCREKGLMGAYLASRFPDFQQVAAVSVESDLYWGQHAFAIACTEYTSQNTLKGWDTWDIETVTSALVASDCYVIDPWADMTVKFTETTAQELGWTSTVISLHVESAPSDDPSTDEAEVCAVPASCQAFDATEEVPESPPYGLARCPLGPVIDEDGTVYPWVDKDGLGGGWVEVRPASSFGDEGSFDCTYDRPNLSLSGSTTLAVAFQRRAVSSWEKTCETFLSEGELEYDVYGQGQAVRAIVHGSDGDPMNLNLNLVEKMQRAGRQFVDSAVLMNQAHYRTCP